MLNKGVLGAREVISQLRHYGPAKQIEFIVGWMGTTHSLRDFEMFDALQREFVRLVDNLTQIENAIKGVEGELKMDERAMSGIARAAGAAFRLVDTGEHGLRMGRRDLVRSFDVDHAMLVDVD